MREEKDKTKKEERVGGDTAPVAEELREEGISVPAPENAEKKKGARRRARDIALIALFVAITVIFGFIKIPMQPVAMSLLTLATALAGCFLSPLHAAFSQAIYVFMGLIGIPVFTTGGGPAYVLQPSFGFLLFLPFMAAGISLAVRHDKFLLAKARFIWRHGVSLLISFLQLLFGTFYYYLLYRYYMNTDLTLEAAVMSCFVLFIPTAIIKSVLSVALFDMLKKRLKLV